MKSLLILTLLSMMALTSCGKKAEVKDSDKNENFDPTTAELYFNAYQDIKKALENNDVEAFKEIVRGNPGIDLNQILPETGETFLTTAIKKELRDLRVFLMEKDSVSLEKANVNKETPLLAAIASNNEIALKVLLDRKVDLEKKDMNGDTALHLALKKGKDQFGVLLIKAGANIHALDKMERNALRVAQEGNVPESLELIKSIMDMEFGAPDIAGFRNILEKADHKRLLNTLSRYPRIATDKAYQAINPLALLVEAQNETAALISADLLLRYEANVNGPEDAEVTPLIKATMHLKQGFAKLYLEQRANPQLFDKDGKTALIHAVEKNNEDLVELLINNRAVEKYTFRKDGKKVTFSACDTAKKVAKSLTVAKDKNINKRIQKLLQCGLFDWLF